MRNWIVSTVVTIAAAGAGAVQAQSLNIDLGTAVGGPSSSFAGAGAAGTWNVLEPAEGQSIGDPSETWLFDLDGLSVAARLIVPAINPQAVNDAGTTGNAESLLDDYLPGPCSLLVRDLVPGHYRVMTYAWTPSAPTNLTTVRIGSTEVEVGGVWTGTATDGVTHSTHIVQPVNGDIDITISAADPADPAVVNGIQLVLLPDLDGDVNDDGVVNVDDLIVVVMNWTTPGHGCDGVDSVCPGDTDGNGTVDIEDLIRVLLDWTG